MLFRKVHHTSGAELLKAGADSSHSLRFSFALVFDGQFQVSSLSFKQACFALICDALDVLTLTGFNMPVGYYKFFSFPAKQQMVQHSFFVASC
jgi:hypothetical protein